MALQLHPDKGSCQEAFTICATAYEVLKKERLRKGITLV